MLARRTFDRLSSEVPSALAARFLALSSLELLNINRQLSWYLALLLLRVASIPSPSSNRPGSSIIGSWLMV